MLDKNKITLSEMYSLMTDLRRRINLKARYSNLGKDIKEENVTISNDSMVHVGVNKIKLDDLDDEETDALRDLILKHVEKYSTDIPYNNIIKRIKVLAGELEFYGGGTCDD